MASNTGKGYRKNAVNVAFYEAFAFNPITCEYDIWVGTGTLATIQRAGLKPDLANPYYGHPSLGGKDGWGCKGSRVDR